ncbi:hypothetical protein T11_12921 [Trichinella zimbabwensis]|uniref:Uncharacterized protein n=1 Tax=Trichinella zimbabwensis TaxID=268475 RepID=A0A0V1GU56_9BILA|nr:hypothetical protein T11_12921 [Trichinella zimbabwensis]
MLYNFLFPCTAFPPGTPLPYCPPPGGSSPKQICMLFFCRGAVFTPQTSLPFCSARGGFPQTTFGFTPKELCTIFSAQCHFHQSNTPPILFGPRRFTTQTMLYNFLFPSTAFPPGTPLPYCPPPGGSSPKRICMLFFRPCSVFTGPTSLPFCSAQDGFPPKQLSTLCAFSRRGAVISPPAPLPFSSDRGGFPTNNNIPFFSAPVPFSHTNSPLGASSPLGQRGALFYQTLYHFLRHGAVFSPPTHLPFCSFSFGILRKQLCTISAPLPFPLHHSTNIFSVPWPFSPYKHWRLFFCSVPFGAHQIPPPEFCVARGGFLLSNLLRFFSGPVRSTAFTKATPVDFVRPSADLFPPTPLPFCQAQGGFSAATLEPFYTTRAVSFPPNPPTRILSGQGRFSPQQLCSRFFIAPCRFLPTNSTTLISPGPRRLSPHELCKRLFRPRVVFSRIIPLTFVCPSAVFSSPTPVPFCHPRGGFPPTTLHPFSPLVTFNPSKSPHQHFVGHVAAFLKTTLHALFPPRAVFTPRTIVPILSGRWRLDRKQIFTHFFRHGVTFPPPTNLTFYPARGGFIPTNMVRFYSVLVPFSCHQLPTKRHRGERKAWKDFGLKTLWGKSAPGQTEINGVIGVETAQGTTKWAELVVEENGTGLQKKGQSLLWENSRKRLKQGEHFLEENDSIPEKKRA